MKYHFQQHMPNFMDFERPPKEEYDSIEDIPIVQRFKKIPGFSKLAYDNHGDRWVLMAIMGDYKSWFVLGYLDEKPNTLLSVKYPKRD